MEDAETTPFVEFSQREDLTVRLRNILHDYAFGPGVFRELLQNADDAGARRFAIYADGTAHPTSESGLLDARLAPWQGPAVVACNDAQFTDSDFHGICQVGASVKRSDHSKIGRYGLGFNSTYHLTDVVSFVSRDRLCIFDPHRAHLPSNLPGLQLRLTPQVKEKYWAQLAPFAEVAGDQELGLGTMFRLPLRTPELAAKSLISNQTRSFEDIVAVLKALVVNAGELLLFLQCVETIEVHVRNFGGPWCCLGRSWIRTSSLYALERMRKERLLLRTMLAKDAKRVARRLGVLMEVVTDSLETRGGMNRRSHAWLLALRSEPVESKEVGSGPAEDELPSHRIAAVAVPLSPEDFKGQAYCFLPLSLATGLPVHVSANFALTANRRDLWRRSDDRVASESQCRAAWNETLIETTCPRAYADALELLAGGVVMQKLEENTLPFPALNTISDKLQQELPSFRDGLWHFWPGGEVEGHFSALPMCVSKELVCREAAVFLDDQQNFQTAKSSLLCRDDDFACLKDEMRAALRRLCLTGRQRTVVQAPARIADTLAEVKGTTWLQPQSLANMLKGFDTKQATTAEADALVEYLLSPQGAGPLALLHGLRLCPLLSGRKGTFLHRVEGQEYFWSADPNMQELLPDEEFVDPSSRTFALLKPRVANSHLNICLLNSKALAKLLPNILPPSWQLSGQVVVTDSRQIEVDGRSQDVLRKEFMASQRKAAPKRGALPKKKQQARKLQNTRKSNSVMEETWDDEDYDDWHDEEEEATEAPITFARNAKATRALPPCPQVATPPCPLVSLEELERLVHRCRLMWKLVEDHQDAGSSMEALLNFPCVPVEAATAPHVGVNGHLRLVSVRCAQAKHMAAVEDFSVEEVRLLESLGVALLRPGKKLRNAVGLDRASVVRALCHAIESELGSPAAVAASGPSARLHMGLKVARLPVERALPLQRLVCSVLRRENKKEAERSLSLPIFPTVGGKFAVPLIPASASIMSPNDAWDESLSPHFPDFLISWEGAAGELLREFEVQRPSLANFLANFCAPRAGLFDQQLSLHFLESIAALGTVFKASGASRDCEKLAQVCEAAPVVVFEAEPGKAPHRCRCSDLVDPDDADISRFLGNAASLPPQPYCTPLILSVLRKAGLRSLADEALFLRAAQRAEALAQNGGPGTAELTSTLLAQLVKRFHGLKWQSQTYSSLSRLRIFPALPASSRAGTRPPSEAPQNRDCVSLDTPCTLFEHAPLAWTQLALLDPQTFSSWPKALLQRFGCLQDPPSLEVVVANLAEIARRWSQETLPPEAHAELRRETIQHRQQVVVQHLKAFQPMLHKRSHATQIMVQHQLSNVNFLVLDDGVLASPCSVFTALHEGADASDDEGQGYPARKRRTQGSWSLPGYMRPFRRLLLGVAGPAVHLKRQLPQIHVPPAPTASIVPAFIKTSLNKPELADVIFVLEAETGLKEIYAHRLVLAAACDHFQVLFTSNCAEAQEPRCRLALPDWVSSRALLWLLAYLYQGFDPREAQEAAYRLDRGLVASEAPAAVAARRSQRPPHRTPCWDTDTGEDLCCLLRLCEFYDVNHLKKWTEHELGKLLTAENLIALSTHAYFCNANQLLNVCIYHLRSQYAELVGVEEWESLEPAIRELVLTDATASAEAAQ